MATIKSSQITNRDATPVVLSNGFLVGGRVHHARGVASITNGGTGGTSGDIHLVCTIPSNACVISVRVTAPDIGTTVTLDTGLYKTTKDGGAVVDADFFKAAVDVHSGAITKSEVAFGNIITVANAEKRIWEHLALSSDPKIDYDVAFTLAANSDAAGAVLLEIDYVA